MSELVHENLSCARGKQKQWYDKSARTSNFLQGDQVLVLLPTDTNNLTAQWQGPYQVVRKIGNVDYQVDMHDHCKRKRIFHVNMLRPWYPTTSNSCFVGEALEETDDFLLWQAQGDTASSKPQLGDDLSPVQRLRLKEVLTKYSEVIQDAPGRTT